MPANTPLDGDKEFVRRRIGSDTLHSFRRGNNIDYMDAPHQIVGISAALIPFLEHDDANRALMGSNMQAQAVPLLRPDVPQVSTGMEYEAARDSGQVVIADRWGSGFRHGETDRVRPVISPVVESGGRRPTQFSGDDAQRSRTEFGRSVGTGTQGASPTPPAAGTREAGVGAFAPRLPDRIYNLRKYQRSNQSTCIDQRPAVVKGQRKHKNEVIADSSSTESGRAGSGAECGGGFPELEGANFEDAIVISERLVQDDKFTSVHIESMK
jgi:DNA-directed RNA polymerase subunit beta